MLLEEELWKTIKYPNHKDVLGLYEVSNLGRVRNKETKHILKPSLNRATGYLIISVSSSRVNQRATVSVHRIVAYNWVSNPNPSMLTSVNHKDETPWNNKTSNLEWCTYAYNNQYNELNQKRFETRSNNIVNGITKIGTSILMKDLNGNIVKEYTNMERIKDAGLSEYYVRLCCNGKKESYLAHKWEYGTKW